MLRDIRYACRILWKNPGFATAAVLAMACGIGACTAVFTLVYTLLLRPLAVPHADDLVSIYALSKSKAAFSAVSMPDYRDLATHTETFEAVGAYFRYPVLLAVGDDPERANTELSSGNYHEMLRVRAALGRMLQPDDDRQGAPAVVVLSDRLWRRRYGASPDVIGRSLRLNGASFEIVGVAPPSFVGVLLDWYGAPDTWVPLSQLGTISKRFGRSAIATRRDQGWLQVTARLRPGVRVEAAAAVLQMHAEQLAHDYPTTNRDVTFTAMPTSRARFWPGRRGTVIDFAAVLLAAAGVLLLIALLNVANLLLARLPTRAREISIRIAIGADRLRIARQLAIEAAVLSCLATVVSMPLSVLLTAAMARMELPFFIAARALDLSPDWRVFGVCASLCAGCGLLLGLTPAWQGWRADVRSGLAAGARSRRTILGVWDMRHTLAALQIAVCVALTFGAGLLGKRLITLTRADLGFSTDRVTLFELDTYMLDYTREQNAAFYHRLLARVRELPGVEAAAFAANVLPTPMVIENGVTAADADDAAQRPEVSMRFNIVSSGYVDALRMRIVAGRAFDARDDEAEASRSAMVNETAARRLWKDPSRGVGQRIHVRDVQQHSVDREVIGVVRDGIYGDADEAPMPYLFLPADRSVEGGLTLHVRGPRDPAGLMAEVRRELHLIDPAFAISEVMTLDEHVATRLAAPSLAARLSLAASAAGVALAMMGLYAVLAYLVAQRRIELAIRMSIGAGPRAIFGFIAAFGLRIVLLGVALGLLGCLAVSRLLETQLHGVDVRNPFLYAAVIVLVLLAAATACFLPARSAARLEPWSILRR
jgi:putative ABC transport system permease protein